MADGTKTLATAKVGDRIWFAEGRMPFTVQARDRRFLICSRPFAVQKTVLYTIVDIKEQVRGPDNMVFGFGYETREACEERLRDLQRKDDPAEVSYRRRITLKVRKIEEPRVSGAGTESEEGR